MFKLLDTVVLTREVPHAGLRQGDLGAIVEVHAPNVFEVEFVAASGRTQLERSPSYVAATEALTGAERYLVAEGAAASARAA